MYAPISGLNELQSANASPSINQGLILRRNQRQMSAAPFADIHAVERLRAVRRAGAKRYSLSIDFSGGLM
jgi:hypothetical protein